MSHPWTPLHLRIVNYACATAVLIGLAPVVAGMALEVARDEGAVGVARSPTAQFLYTHVPKFSSLMEEGIVANETHKIPLSYSAVMWGSTALGWSVISTAAAIGMWSYRRARRPSRRLRSALARTL